MFTGSTADCAGSRSEAGAFTFEAAVALAIAASVVVSAQFVEAQATRRLSRARAEWAELLRVQTMLSCLPRLDDRASDAQGTPLLHPACAPVAERVRGESSSGMLHAKSVEIDGLRQTHLSLRFTP